MLNGLIATPTKELRPGRSGVFGHDTTVDTTHANGGLVLLLAPPLLVARIVGLNVPATIGVPEITPVLESRIDSPFGNGVVPGIEKTNGGVPDNFGLGS
jgi:hypothetical protein